MKRTSIVIVGILVVVAAIFHARLIAWFTGKTAGEAGTAVAVTAGPYRVALALDPDPPRERGQAMRATVTDAAGQAVDGASVELTYDMPAMGQMAEMKASAPGKPAGGGVYETTFDLPMGGTWGVWVKVAKQDCAIARFKLTIGQPGLAADGAGGCSKTADATIQIDEARQRELGITTAKVVRAPMTLDIRAVGKLTYDESRLSDVVLKVGGYVSDLRVRATGQAVRKGEMLFMLYSPELFAAQQDFLVARSSKDIMGSGMRSEGIVRAAEKKLELLGLTAAQIQQIAEKNEPIEKIAFAAPASGSVIEKAVVDGDAVQAGQRLFRIAALDKVWVEADLFEADLPRIAVGMPASVAIGTRALDGKVTFVYPYLDPQTRTGRVRIELPNQGLDLKPDMYATATFHVALGDRLQVPTSAIVYTGPRRLVFVELGGGALRGQEVTLGAASGDHTEITGGVAEGDVIVTSGNFLVAAESRLRGAP